MQAHWEKSKIDGIAGVLVAASCQRPLCDLLVPLRVSWMQAFKQRVAQIPVCENHFGAALEVVANTLPFLKHTTSMPSFIFSLPFVSEELLNDGCIWLDDFSFINGIALNCDTLVEEVFLLCLETVFWNSFLIDGGGCFCGDSVGHAE